MPNETTVVVIHGYGVNGSQEWNITAGLLEAGVEANYFLVVWSYYAGETAFPSPNTPLLVTPSGIKQVPNLYVQAAKHSQTVAQATARFFVWLHDIGYINGENIHLIGHSLGAHLAGDIGRLYRAWTSDHDTIHRISALDPAAPLYTKPLVPIFRRLDGTDANYVDVYHTNQGVLGAGVGTLENIKVTFVSKLTTLCTYNCILTVCSM